MSKPHLPKYQTINWHTYNPSLILPAHPIIGHGADKRAPQKAKLAMAVRGQSNHYLIDRIQPTQQRPDRSPGQ